MSLNDIILGIFCIATVALIVWGFVRVEKPIVMYCPKCRRLVGEKYVCPICRTQCIRTE